MLLHAQEGQVIIPINPIEPNNGNQTEKEILENPERINSIKEELRVALAKMMVARLDFEFEFSKSQREHLEKKLKERYTKLIESNRWEFENNPNPANPLDFTKHRLNRLYFSWESVICSLDEEWLGYLNKLQKEKWVKKINKFQRNWEVIQDQLQKAKGGETKP